MPIERIAAFIRGEQEASFSALALELFRAQWQRHGRFRELCEARGASPDTVLEWRSVPPLAAAELGGQDPGEGQEPDRCALARLAAERSFPTGFTQGLGRPPLLSLAPPDGGPGGGARLAQWALAAWAAPDSLTAAARRGVEVAKARSFLGARQRDRRPTVVLGTTTALRQLLAALDRRGLRFRLPAGSRVIAADGDGQPDSELLAALAESLAVPAESVLREYAPPGTPTRFYAGHGRRGEPLPFAPPPWARARVVAPDTLAERPAGDEGLIALFDLASAAPPAHRLTGDQGITAEDGFLLAARTGQG